MPPEDIQVLAQEAAETWQTMSNAGVPVTIRWCVEKTLEWWAVPTVGSTADAVLRAASSIIR
jgi:hypothetical protein